MNGHGPGGSGKRMTVKLTKFLVIKNNSVASLLYEVSPPSSDFYAYENECINIW